LGDRFVKSTVDEQNSSSNVMSYLVSASVFAGYAPATNRERIPLGCASNT
jgi:hypothetical protein